MFDLFNQNLPQALSEPVIKSPKWLCRLCMGIIYPNIENDSNIWIGDHDGGKIHLICSDKHQYLIKVIAEEADVQK